MDIFDNTIKYSGSGTNQQTYGLDVIDSYGWTIDNNIIKNFAIGAQMTGSCSSPNNFTLNKFQGSMNTGLRVQGTMGPQGCHTNRWEGTFMGVGYDCWTNPLGNLIEAHPNSSNVYKPTFSNPLSVDYNEFTCAQLMLVAPGNQDDGLVSSAATSTINKFELYPNPSKGFFNILLRNFENNENIKVNITDLSGKILFIQKIESGITQEKIDIRNLNVGVYLVHILSEGYRQTEKLIVTD